MSDDVKSTNYKTCPYQSDFINAVIRQHLVSVGKRELALFFEKDSNDGLSQDYAAREESLRSAIASMDIDTRAVLAKARLVFNLVHTALPVIENIDAKKNPLRNDFFMQALIREMKENGSRARDREGFLNTVRIWKSRTPHPRLIPPVDRGRRCTGEGQRRRYYKHYQSVACRRYNADRQGQHDGRDHGGAGTIKTPPHWYSSLIPEFESCVGEGVWH